MRKALLADSLPAIGCGGYSDELPSLAVLPAVGGDDVDRLPDLGVWAQDLPSIDERLSNALPAIDALLVVGSDDVDDSCDLPVLELADSEVSGVSAVGGCDRSTHLPAVETLAARAAAGNLELTRLCDPRHWSGAQRKKSCAQAQAQAKGYATALSRTVGKCEYTVEGVSMFTKHCLA